MDLAVKDIVHHKGKFVATIIGVGLLFAVVLSMNGIYRGFIFEGLSTIQVTSPDLWVVERNRGGPFNEQSTIPDFFHYSIEAIEGVEKASPFIFYGVERLVKGKRKRFTIIGYDVFGGLGGPQKLTGGRHIRQAHYEMVAHEKLKFHLGDSISLGLHSYTVVGLFNDGTAPDGEPLVYLSLPDAQEILYLRDNEEIRNQRERLLRTFTVSGRMNPEEAQKYISLLETSTHMVNAHLVKLAPGSNAIEIARRIEESLYFSVYSNRQQIDLMMQGRLAMPRKQLLLFRIILLIVSVVIIALVVYTFTMEKIRSIAVMKLIGAPNRVIVRLVLEQALLLTACSYLFGLLVIHNAYQYFPRLVRLTAFDDVLTFLIVLAGAVIASVLGIVQALKTEPALALGGA
jgi:putative ABC transport system permease protein